ncbi:MAG: hypothetical protein KJ732_03545, partial [Candidatus Margulisbacteria bacterium]|nr:hypothetical protein [Candidatus Margulisiibacteriota bacterium]
MKKLLLIPTIGFLSLFLVSQAYAQIDQIGIGDGVGIEINFGGITAASPESGHRGETLDVTLTYSADREFNPVTDQISFGDGITVNSAGAAGAFGSFVSQRNGFGDGGTPFEKSFNITISDDAAYGARDVSIIMPELNTPLTGSGVFSVFPTTIYLSTSWAPEENKLEMVYDMQAVCGENKVNVVSATNKVFKTTDRGQNWTQNTIPNADNVSAYGLHYLDENNGLVVGGITAIDPQTETITYNARIFSENNGTFSNKTPSFAQNDNTLYLSTYAYNNNNFLVTGWSNEFKQCAVTTDGGNSWTNTSVSTLATTAYIIGVADDANETTWIRVDSSGGEGMKGVEETTDFLYASTDKGLTWTLKANRNQAPFNEQAFVITSGSLGKNDEAFLYGYNSNTGDGLVFATANNGTSWTTYTLTGQPVMKGAYDAKYGTHWLSVVNYQTQEYKILEVSEKFDKINQELYAGPTVINAIAVKNDRNVWFGGAQRQDLTYRPTIVKYTLPASIISMTPHEFVLGQTYNNVEIVGKNIQKGVIFRSGDKEGEVTITNVQIENDGDPNCDGSGVKATVTVIVDKTADLGWRKLVLRNPENNYEATKDDAMKILDVSAPATTTTT